MKKPVIQILFLCISLYASAQQTQESISWTEAISKAANEELRQSGTPSLQIAIGYKDSLIFEQAYGLADIENAVPATIKSEYRTASISKWWTATAAMMLVEQGKLNPDAPIQTYCSHFPVKKWPVTVRHLLTHTSGIRSYLDLDEELSKAKNADDSLRITERYNLELLGQYTRYTTLNASLQNFAQDSLLFEPGMDWLYASQGYRVLGCVLEDVAGMAYPSLMKSLIFNTAAMHDTKPDDSWEIIYHRVSGYQLEGDKSIRRAEMRDVSENLPAGGFVSTAGDLVRFAMAYMNEEFVSSETIKLMSLPFITKHNPPFEAPSWRDAIPSAEKYGYGVMLYPDRHAIRIGHDGRQAGFSSIVMIMPDKNLTIAVMTNAKGWNGYIDFTQKIEKIVTAGFQN